MVFSSHFLNQIVSKILSKNPFKNIFKNPFKNHIKTLPRAVLAAVLCSNGIMGYASLSAQDLLDLLSYDLLDLYSFSDKLDQTQWNLLWNLRYRCLWPDRENLWLLAFMLHKLPLVGTFLWYKSFENTVGKGEITRNEQFLLSHVVFYFFQELSAIFIKCEIVVCKLFQFGGVYKLYRLGKG